jgi:hypothetical protein
MWNPDKTGILVDRGNNVLAFLESGPEFDSVKPTAADWHEVPDPEPEPPTIEEQQANRQAAFQREADPLFFKWQAGEGTEEAWQAKRAEIRERYPYPE